MLSLIIPAMIAGAVQYSPVFVDTAGWYFPPPNAVKGVEAGQVAEGGEGGQARDMPARIDVNEASAAQLQRLPGIGPKKADLIIKARTRRPFRRASDLLRVKGVGRKTLKRMMPMLVFRKRSRVRGADRGSRGVEKR